MNSETLLLRQVHPSFVQNGRITTQAFTPTLRDQNRLSVYDGDLIEAEPAWIHYTSILDLQSIGVVAVTVAECVRQWSCSPARSNRLSGARPNRLQGTQGQQNPRFSKSPETGGRKTRLAVSVGKSEMTAGLLPYPAYKPSGVPWLGDVPEHWEVRRLKSVCHFTYGTDTLQHRHVRSNDRPVPAMEK